MHIFFRHLSGIGVSLHEHHVEVVQVNPRSGYAVTGCVRLALDEMIYKNGLVVDPAAFAAECKSRLEAAGIAGRAATLCLPSSMVVLRILSMPRVKRKRAKAMLQFQMEHEIHMPFPDPVFDFDYFPTSFPAELAGQNPEEVDALVLLAVAPGEAVQRLEEAFRRMGMPLMAVEVKGLANLRALRALGRVPEEGTLLIQLGPDAVEAHYYTHGQFLLSRWLDLNPQDYASEQLLYATTSYSVDAEVAASQVESVPTGGRSVFAADLQFQIDRVLSYLQYALRRNENAVSRVWIVGRGTDRQEIASQLSAHLGMPAASLEQPRTPDGDEVDLSAFGAALRGVVSDAD